MNSEIFVFIILGIFYVDGEQGYDLLQEVTQHSGHYVTLPDHTYSKKGNHKVHSSIGFL